MLVSLRGKNSNGKVVITIFYLRLFSEEKSDPDKEFLFIISYVLKNSLHKI